MPPVKKPKPDQTKSSKVSPQPKKVVSGQVILMSRKTYLTGTLTVFLTPFFSSSPRNWAKRSPNQRHAPNVELYSSNTCRMDSSKNRYDNISSNSEMLRVFDWPVQNAPAAAKDSPLLSSNTRRWQKWQPTPWTTIWCSRKLSKPPTYHLSNRSSTTLRTQWRKWRTR